MRVLCVTGPLGSGKTTTILRLAAESGIPENTQLIVNEVGAIQIDTDRLAGIVPSDRINSLVAGCLGCDSAAEFDELVAKLKVDGVEYVVIEPTGVADPREIKEVTDRHGLDWSCLTLMNTQTFDLNRVEGMLAAQLSVATTVGITRPSLVDERSELFGYIAGHAAVAAVFEIQESTLLPFSFESLLSNKVARRVDRGDFGHGHQHGHGYTTMVFAVDEACDTTWLEKLFQEMDAPPERAKGVLAGRDFDWVGSDMKVGRSSDQSPHVVVISRAEFDPALLDGHTCISDVGDKKKLMRNTDASLDETLDAIRWHAGHYPVPKDMSGLPMLGAESDIAWQMTRRAGVPDDYKCLALTARMQFLLSAAEVLADAEQDDRYPTRLRLSRDLLELGAALAWNAHENRMHLGEELIAAIALAKPAHLAIRGLGMLPTLRLDLMADDASGATTPEALRSVLAFGFAHEGMNHRDALEALYHARELACGHGQWLLRWQSAIDAIEGCLG